MFRWIFRKSGNEPGSTPASATTDPSPGAGSSAADVDWAALLAQARGDEDALLALAMTAGASLKVKQTAVEGLDSEAALKRAERDFRSHDRRVHQLAKQRLLAKAAQRQTREQAAQLLETARGLAAMAEVPVNRLVEIDKAWQSLDAGAIESAQNDAFAALTAQLAEQIRQRADIELQRKRWLGDSAAALRQLQATCAEAAAGTQDRGHLAGSIGAARVVESSLPPGDMAVPATARALADLQHAIGIATTLDAHLVVLDRLLAVPAETPASAADGSTAGLDAADPPKTEATDSAGDDADRAPAVLPAAVDDLQRTWQALSPLTDTPLAALLQTRQERWQQAHDQARQALQSHRREQARERQRARKSEGVMALADAVAQAETALEAGQLADAHRHLSNIDDQLQGGDAPVALRTRILVSQARLSQLRGWQHWAGGRARDELVLQAEALAAATVGGGNDKGGAGGEGDSADGVAAEVARLSIRQRAEVIATLRKRWKEIDGPHGDGGRALWRRFDAALTAAGEPVTAHVAAQRAAREANLSVRLQLIEWLEAVGVTAEGGSAASADLAVTEDDVAQPQAIAGPPAEPPIDARGLASALDRFNAEWRKLGPLEHTIPRAARAALDERMQAAVRRLEVPLQEARARAGAQRLSLLARARALAGDGPVRGRDLVGEVRALQSEWQQHARALPLARVDEQAMWADFKAAIDTAFAAREAVHSAREAEFEAHATERSALIERLRLRLEDQPGTQRRTLAEVDAAWQRCGPAPRARAAALDAEFRAARDEMRRRLDDSAQRAWQATCEALDAKLALCLAREQGAAPGAENDAAATAASWSTLPMLPAPLEDAMRRRAGLASADNPGTASDINDLLLQIESAWDLPTPSPFETARRARKLLAMKASLEGRRSLMPEAMAPVAALAQLLSRDGLDVDQRSRLAAVLVAWRLQGPQRLP